MGEIGGGGDAARALRASNWQERSKGDGFREAFEDDASFELSGFGVTAFESDRSSFGILGENSFTESMS